MPQPHNPWKAALRSQGGFPRRIGSALFSRRRFRFFGKPTQSFQTPLLFCPIPFRLFCRRSRLRDTRLRRNHHEGTSSVAFGDTFPQALPLAGYAPSAQSSRGNLIRRLRRHLPAGAPACGIRAFGAIITMEPHPSPSATPSPSSGEGFPFAADLCAARVFPHTNPGETPVNTRNVDKSVDKVEKERG